MSLIPRGLETCSDGTIFVAMQRDFMKLAVEIVQWIPAESDTSEDSQNCKV
jgi:hypothetical protein